MSSNTSEMNPEEIAEAIRKSMDIATKMFKDKISNVNKLLKEGEPGNISKPDKSTNYVGYSPQPIIDAMNEVFGIGGWGFEEVSNELMLDGGGMPTMAIAEVYVHITGVDFRPKAFGQSRVTRGDIGDAKKGAQTDAIKKALSYFSVGNRAYLGMLDKTKSAPRPAPSNKITEKQVKKILYEAGKIGMRRADVEEKMLKGKKITQLDRGSVDAALDWIEAAKMEKEGKKAQAEKAKQKQEESGITQEDVMREFGEAVSSGFDPKITDNQ